MLELTLTIANCIGIFLVYKATKSLIKENRYNQKIK